MVQDRSPDRPRTQRKGRALPPTTPPSAATPPLLWALRVAALLQLAALLWEGATAGQLVTFNMDALSLHYSGAFGVHLTGGLLLVAAVVHRYRSRSDPGPARTLLWVALAAFLLGFVQAALGHYGPLQAHVPLALVLTGVAAWATVLAWRQRA